MSAPSTAIVTVPGAPALTVAKTADRTEITAAGEVITYSFRVTNTGNVTIADVTVDEVSFSGTGAAPVATCPAAAASLEPGAQVTCTAAYEVTRADIDAGGVTNTSTVTGDPPGTLEPPVSAPSTVEVLFDGTNSLAIEKRATTVDVNGNRIIDLGDRVEWTIIVTNTGAQTVSDIAVSDPTAGAVTCPATSLASGEQMTCTVPPHTIDAADVRRGEVRNIATVRGNTTAGPINPPTSETITRVVPTPPTGLAVTGGTLAAGGLLLGGVMVLAGLGPGRLTRVRRREEEQEQR